MRAISGTIGTIIANYGVPQGSPISPLLFIIFFSLFDDLTHKHERYRSMYTDDLAISASGKADKHSHIVLHLQPLVDNVREVFNTLREKASLTKKHTRFALRVGGSAHCHVSMGFFTAAKQFQQGLEKCGI